MLETPCSLQKPKHAEGLLQGRLPLRRLVRGPGQLSKPTVKQHLAALRMLFDWLVVGHVLDVNPAHAVRGPKYSQKKGNTPAIGAASRREHAQHVGLQLSEGHGTVSQCVPPSAARSCRRAFSTLL
jgi:hypothetical protein